MKLWALEGDIQTNSTTLYIWIDAASDAVGTSRRSKAREVSENCVGRIYELSDE